MSDNNETIKKQILSALSHPEAEEGLYLRNLYHLHEEDERPAVDATESDIMAALNDLVREGRIALDESGDEVVFQLTA